MRVSHLCFAISQSIRTSRAYLVTLAATVPRTVTCSRPPVNGPLSNDGKPCNLLG